LFVYIVVIVVAILYLYLSLAFAFIFSICNHLNMSLQLLSFRADLYEYIFIEQLMKNINKHAKNQDYAMTRKRSKRFKKDVLIKI